MSHRPPTRADIGRTVEVSRDGNEWISGKLASIEYHDRDSDATYWIDDGKPQWTFGWTGRVPYDCPDLVAELSILADEMAMAGHDEASKILGLFAAMDNTQRAHVLRMIEEKDPALNPIDFRLRNEYGILHFDRRSLYRPS